MKTEGSNNTRMAVFTTSPRRGSTAEERKKEAGRQDVPSGAM